MENVISEEIANKEIQKWLDFKNVSPRKRNTKETDKIIFQINGYQLCLSNPFYYDIM